MPRAHFKRFFGKLLLPFGKGSNYIYVQSRFAFTNDSLTVFNYAQSSDLSTHVSYLINNPKFSKMYCREAAESAAPAGVGGGFPALRLPAGGALLAGTGV